MTFTVNDQTIRNDLEDIIRLFYPEYGLRFLPQEPQVSLSAEIFQLEGKIRIDISVDGAKILTDERTDFDAGNGVLYKRFYKRFCKNALYKALNAYTRCDMPWGSLTGIRPLRPARELALESLGGAYDPLQMSSRYFLSLGNAILLGKILDAQSEFFSLDKAYVNLYVHIPFCKTRCDYCSFPADSISRADKLLPQYFDALEREIFHARGLIERYGKKLLSAYVGGGTPTSVPDVYLRRVLFAASPGGAEYTLEAGRPDSITESNLLIARETGVTRVCVNPQTFCGETLQRIGRGHTVEEFYEKYALAKNLGFDLNTDIIAGLSGEDFDTFRNSVDSAAKLMPENITVHTLSVKSGSKLKENSGYGGADAGKMTGYSAEVLNAAGYIPYYIYRQKYMACNGENIGWCIPGKQCVNNISVMEELHSVIACGCGAISKFVFPSGGRIERLANPKDLRLYLENLGAILAKKEKMLENSLH